MLCGRPPVRAKGRQLCVSWKLWMARPICLRLLAHLMRLAASRTFCTAGKSSAIKTAMMAITTNNSISVKPIRRADPGEEFDITNLRTNNTYEAGNGVHPPRGSTRTVEELESADEPTTSCNS